LAEWVGREILPHERDLRLWLQRRLVGAADVEDIVQECYCRLAQLSDVSHVTMPRAYLFTMARNLAQRQRQRARVVRIEAMADSIEADWESDQPSPERIAAARQELGRVQAALATLSDRARRIFVMRKVDGLTQKEIAQALGVSEAVVENEASRSLRKILKLMTEPESEQMGMSAKGVSHARSR
jgi:RNA polymerase sigma-70 factor (ECF subfamily)